MPDITVNTSAPGYQSRLADFRQLRAYYAPHFKLYFQLTADDQRTWRQDDPLLRELLDFARKVDKRKRDVL